jgi:hypothetical protein
MSTSVACPLSPDYPIPDHPRAFHICMEGIPLEGHFRTPASEILARDKYADNHPAVNANHSSIKTKSTAPTSKAPPAHPFQSQVLTTPTNARWSSICIHLLATFAGFGILALPTQLKKSYSTATTLTQLSVKFYTIQTLCCICICIQGLPYRTPWTGVWIEISTIFLQCLVQSPGGPSNLS